MEAMLPISESQMIYATVIACIAPLLSFALAFVIKKLAPAISILGITVSFICSAIVFFAVWNSGSVYHFSIPWVDFSGFKINAGILVNNLTVVMLLLVSFIALLVNIYSVEYMQHDADRPKYFAYLSLFCFAMLALVVADNLFLVYAFWELVGFASYLLIGFWFTRESAAKASKKAFIMNRIGDVGFLVGLLIIYSQFKTLDIDAIFGAGNLISSSFIHQGNWVTPFAAMPDYWLTIAGLCFFAGAIAKSAQFPLHTWLPDAMEGPTAVSSLIHAATMVAAGVFLLVRIEPLFNETVLTVIASIGLFTAFMAATVGLTQNDIKRVLAFSTVSQLGFMMLAIGVGNSASAIFHLVTHAFFKCLLFLGAGIVIHEMQHLKDKYKVDFDPQDMLNMGGLRKRLPVTFIVFLIAALALSGLPLTSGYLSKDAILLSVFDWSNLKGGVFWAFPVLISIASWCTTFYIFRLIFKVFFGEFRLPKFINATIDLNKIHDPSNWMKIPVIVLAVFCIGFVFSVSPLSLEQSWLYSVFSEQHEANAMLHLLVPVYINALSLLLIFAAYKIYAQNSFKPNMENSWFYRFSYNQWYFNEFYQAVFVNTTVWKAKFWYWFDMTVIDGFVNLSGKFAIYSSYAFGWFDRNIVDGLVNFSALVVERIGIWFRAVHNGKFQHYVVWMLIIFLSFFIFQMIF
ncbi:NADH-quinone oxidoreductase subunit L [Pseudopedobacter sp.]|uniref:NADH-quinone oxidoreductase subunit L n=1 Tax=Pseudopedobacter sp. TaxID=1936787 RepID=UPI003342608A